MPTMTTRQKSIPPLTRVGRTSSHLSHTQSLPKTRNQKTLIPVRPSQQDNRFCKSEQQLLTADGQCASPLDKAFEAPTRTEQAAKSAVSEDEEDSVLAKYIERFRHGQPQSREERQQMSSAVGEETAPFWWTSSSCLAPSSTPAKNPQNDAHRTHVRSPAGDDRSLSPCRRSDSASSNYKRKKEVVLPEGLKDRHLVCLILSDMSQSDFEDIEILHLQERASTLLHRGEGSVPVSSEGLGSSDFSSPPSREELMRKPFPLSSITSTSATAMTDARFGTFQKSISGRPEEDILLQWRLRRRMEQAVEDSQSQPHLGLHVPACNWQGTRVQHTSANGHACKQSVHPLDPAQRCSPSHTAAAHPDANSYRADPPSSGLPPNPVLCLSDSLAPQPWPLAHVPMHTHLLCDVLPCPVRSSQAVTEPSISHAQEESSTKAPSQKTPVLGISKATSTDDFICKSSPSPPPQGDKPGCQEIHQRDKKGISQKKNVEVTKKTPGSIRRQKKPTTEHADEPTRTNKSPSPQRVPKKGLPCMVQQQLERCQEFSSAGEDGARTSMIRSTLGQVVSEVLFPTSDSSPAQRTPASSLPSQCTAASTAPQHSLPPQNVQNSMEVISQLLQEAEDSDEKEFGDDPILKVLRKQRKWVKDQIREVDSILDKFPDDQQDS